MVDVFAKSCLPTKTSLRLELCNNAKDFYQCFLAHYIGQIFTFPKIANVEGFCQVEKNRGFSHIAVRYEYPLFLSNGCCP